MKPRGHPPAIDVFSVAWLSRELIALGVRPDNAAHRAAIAAWHERVDPDARLTIVTVARRYRALRDSPDGSMVGRRGRQKLVQAFFQPGLINAAAACVPDAYWPAGVPREAPAPPFVPFITARLFGKRPG